MPPLRAARTKASIAWLSTIMMLAACTSRNPQPESTLTPTGVLTPYQTPTPSRTPPITLSSVTATLIPRPTATPFTYTIVEGDTLLAIAFRFGVTVDEIRTVNPGINPRILSVGSELIIPIAGGGQVVIPSPTPVAIVAGKPQCHPTADEGLWCFVPVLNENIRPIEGLSAEITLTQPDGVTLMTADALPPLNLIPAGRSLPLVAFFPPPVPDSLVVQSRLKSSFVLSADDRRYLPASPEVTQVEISLAGDSAITRGRVVLEGDGDAPLDAVVWIAVVGYGADWEVVGVRRWEREVQILPGEPLPFAVRIFSVGPPITRVEVFTEVRPLAIFEQQ